MSLELDAGKVDVTLVLLPCSSMQRWQLLMLGISMAGGCFKDMGSLFPHWSLNLDAWLLLLETGIKVS